MGFAAWFGGRLAQRVAAKNLNRTVAVVLLATGAVMLHSSVAGDKWRKAEDRPPPGRFLGSDQGVAGVTCHGVLTMVPPQLIWSSVVLNPFSLATETCTG
jgi:uncharacterized membrane protein YfcA